VSSFASSHGGSFTGRYIAINNLFCEAQDADMFGGTLDGQRARACRKRKRNKKNNNNIKAA
jgi:hypothetical protein